MKLRPSTQDKLPQGVLFTPGPRIEDLGWGWTVTRFGNPSWNYHIDALSSLADTSSLRTEHPFLNDRKWITQ